MKPERPTPDKCVTLGIRRFRAEAHRLLSQIGIDPSSAADDRLIAAWLDERSPAEFAFTFAEQFGAIDLRNPRGSQ